MFKGFYVSHTIREISVIEFGCPCFLVELDCAERDHYDSPERTVCDFAWVAAVVYHPFYDVELDRVNVVRLDLFDWLTFASSLCDPGASLTNAEGRVQLLRIRT
jgi:hypothetical protein